MSIKGFFDDAGDWFGEALETVGEFLANPKYTLARGEAVSTARVYNLGRDQEAFEELWALVIKATLLGHANYERAVAEVDRLIGRLPDLAAQAPDQPTLGRSPVVVLDEDGLRGVHVGDVADRFVVFSDHHMLNAGHRQDFFASSGNRDLYVDILRGYYGPAGYVLVEKR